MGPEGSICLVIMTFLIIKMDYHCTVALYFLEQDMNKWRIFQRLNSALSHFTRMSIHFIDKHAGI